MNTDNRRVPNLVIRASAGAGKTFQLSNRFLNLALDGAPIETILATTFTRKAAGEILSRVLARLAEAALDDDTLAGLAEHLGRSGLTRSQCLDLLRNMVKQLHRFRVGTLDSVFVQMARSFSLELGLPPGWRICDEAEERRLRAEAVRDLVQRVKTSDTLRLMHLLSKGETARSVAREILDLVNELHQIHADAPAEAWSALGRRKPLLPEEVAAAIEAVAAVTLPSHKSLAKARENDVQHARGEQWEAFLSGGVAKQVCLGSATYYGKDISGDVTAAYTPLIEHAKAEVLGAIANQNEATRDMLARFDESYSRLQTARRAFRFDDVTQRLGAAVGSWPVAQVVYRLDAHLAHLLLDEFQDTSPSQWRVLEPLARQVVGRSDSSFFCVGDVKQAIYGWRGGVAEIFEAIAEKLQPLASQELDKSWRSSPVITDFVNRVFDRVADNDAVRKYARAAAAWGGRFRTHSTARGDRPGYCCVETAPAAEEGQKQTHVTLDFAARRIAELHRAAPERTIGVLVRTNKSVARLIYQLHRQGILASEEGGNPLTDSPAVQLVLSLVRLADHPGDTAARFHVASGPLGKTLGFSRFDDDAASLRLSAELRRRLVEDGYGPTIYAWTMLVAPHCGPRDRGRLAQLVEMAYGYEPQATTRADRFIELVEQQRVEDPTSSAVRVMTIHQAKGLEFDVVVLPELDGKLLGGQTRLVVGRPGPTEQIQRVCRYVGEKLRPALPRVFAEMFEVDENRRVEESLCLLYVALTRAVHALHVVIAPSTANERTIPSTPAALLRVALTGPDPVQPHSILYTAGDPNWAGSDGTVGLSGIGPSTAGQASSDTLTPGPVHAAPAGPTIRLAEPGRRFRRGLERRSPSQLEGGPRVELASRIRFDAGEGRERGTVMHEWFEQIGWIEDGLPTDDAFRELARQHEPDEATVGRWLAEFHAAIERPEVRAVLRRSSYDARGGEMRLWRERPFAVRQDDAIVNGTIDRLVVFYDGAKPVSAEVLDFKTDRLPADQPAAVDARVEFYRPQMEAYARAVAAMFALPAERVTARLLFVDVGTARVLET